MTQRHSITRVRHELKRRRVTVAHTERLTPRMIRVVVEGPDLEGFVSLGHDDHVKLFFAAGDDAGELAIGQRGPAYPEGIAPPPMRDFTPRHYDPVKQRLTLDFAIHPSGPATEWAEQASPGQTLAFGGPRGSFVVADDFDWYLLAGDETAIPAIARRLEQLRPDALALVVITVVDALEEQHLNSSARTMIQWLHRPQAAAADPSPLIDALAALTLPSGEGYAWVATESGIAKAARTHLVSERGLNPAWVKAAGYWRAGDMAVHEVHSG